MIVQADITIRGDVQGVFFRSYAAEKAAELNVTGWVRNEPDGTVKVCAQGEPEKVQQFTDWCRQGPPRAKVETLEVALSDAPKGTFQAFEIR